MVKAIWFALIILAVWFGIILFRDFVKYKNNLENVSWGKTAIIGFIVNFFDVLGIGAFAPQTALLKLTKQTEDRVLPGTLNSANTIPVLIEAIIFIKIIEVDSITLISMLVAATIGAVIGAGIVSKLPEKIIQLTMGCALLVTAYFMLAGQMHWMPGGGDAIGLHGTKLIIAVVINFILGALMTAGIGLYAPCMALVFMLGMSPKVAFPIMMGSCAFLMPPASAKFVKEGAYNRKASVSMCLAGTVGVLIAAFLVKSLPMDILRWLVIAVVIYTATIMLKSAFKNKSKQAIA
ncbi:sulfite exporter TauE/SafE family protein [Clostridium botulinum]|uniref:sulfite exporter TauE/SafE family protein n=1 Tax=Clostridium botulinum TaxID=1491 RepID=UPI000773205E|nr:sulfite exporter TauE/SafE family protein [Clostridium botulinum]MBY6953148.1 sulfite exporter TauE/SafE family protein [Clostridium botulinum]MCR1137216.1 sulfite exporter TauE/SafE family protein [Clostridium botulinum]MCR1166786.1 sulfite exporter TauE/SafE family protein [Clostridium botulinum]NEZ78633.1 sulfite exporter TauE/SafE family protein [Clostridium botulinum]NFA18120.1 sulfite exporter TauE/SafE family protein [Clostridium botulinum]